MKFEIIDGDIYAVTKAGYKLDLSAMDNLHIEKVKNEFGETMQVDTDSFYDLGNAKLCRGEDGKMYAVEFYLGTHEPLIWCALTEQTFADKLYRAYCNSNGLTQKAFAEKLGVPLRTFEDWIKGRRTPSRIVQDSVLDKVKNLAGGSFNLMRDTGHEAGIIVFEDNSVTVCNWQECDDNQLPLLLPISQSPIPWTFNGDHKLIKLKDCDDIRNELPGTVWLDDENIVKTDIKINYDASNDLTALFGIRVGNADPEIYQDANPYKGAVWKLDDEDITILTIDSWN